MAAGAEKPTHVVFFPFPAQGHVTPALQLAKLLHHRHGLQVTFVHSEHNRRRLLRARGPGALDGVPGSFRFAAVPDGLPPSETDDDAPQDIPALFFSMETASPHFKNLVSELIPPVTFVVSDMCYILRTASDMGIPCVTFWTTSACCFQALQHMQQLVDREIVPLKDAEQLSNGYLDSTVVDWVPGMPKDMRLRDFPSFIRTTDPDDAVLTFLMRIMACHRATPSAIIVHTFDELEHDVITAMSMSTTLPPIYAVGPLPLLLKQVGDSPLQTLGSNLSSENHASLGWLSGRRANSVVYVSFGSLVTLTNEQFAEFSWGLAGSGHDFLWVIRNDQVNGTDPAAMLPRDFLEETKERGYVTSWCPQEAVLQHEAIGAFLTHCGWNSMLEGISAGVPMLCLPFVADQLTNRRYACSEWHIGMEISGNLERDEVKAVIREVMEGDKGKDIKRMVMEWKEKAIVATLPGGPSWVNLDKVVSEVLTVPIVQKH